MCLNILIKHPVGHEHQEPRLTFNGLIADLGQGANATGYAVEESLDGSCILFLGQWWRIAGTLTSKGYLAGIHSPTYAGTPSAFAGNLV